jgi:hypothetical protein
METPCPRSSGIGLRLANLISHILGDVWNILDSCISFTKLFSTWHTNRCTLMIMMKVANR